MSIFLFVRFKLFQFFTVKNTETMTWTSLMLWREAEKPQMDRTRFQWWEARALTNSPFTTHLL